MKILFVVNSLVGGGAEKVFMDMLYNLNKNNYEITVLSIDDVGVYKEDVKRVAEYKTIIRHAQKPAILHYMRGAMAAFWAVAIRRLPALFLYKLFVHEQYDVEVAYLEGMATKVVSGSTNKNAVKYAWIHTDMIKNPWTRGQYRNPEEEMRCYQRMDYVMAVSQAVKEAADSKFNIQAQVQYNILDDAHIRKVAESGKRRFKKTKGTAFVSVGSLWHIKGYMRLIAIFKKLVEEGYSTELHLIGTGEDEQKIDEFIKRYALEQHIIMHGFQQAPYDLLSCGDVYVCPSYAEGFSTSVTEALILGLPVITTECAGMRELLGDSEYGYIVENTDEGLENGLKTFLDNPEKRVYYKQKARERGQDFCVKNRIGELEAKFEEAVKKNRGQK